MTKQQTIISSRTNEQLINDWVTLDEMAVTPEIATVRGWMMDKIEKRFPTEFDQWMESCEVDDSIRNYIHI